LQDHRTLRPKDNIRDPFTSKREIRDWLFIGVFGFDPELIDALGDPVSRLI